MERMVIITYWFSLKSSSLDTYKVFGRVTGQPYFSGTYDECCKFAEDNDMSVLFL